MTEPDWVDLHGLDATKQYAQHVQNRLPEGSVVVLAGPLGAGKTTFVRAFVQAAEGPKDVTSPTYTLMHEYPTPRGLVVHIDAYRLQDAHDTGSLGLDDAIDRARFTLIEWGDRIASALPPFWRLELDRPAGTQDIRRARLTPPQENA